jgi:hypothetical protein
VYAHQRLSLQELISHRKHIKKQNKDVNFVQLLHELFSIAFQVIELLSQLNCLSDYQLVQLTENEIAFTECSYLLHNHIIQDNVA